MVKYVTLKFNRVFAVVEVHGLRVIVVTEKNLWRCWKQYCRRYRRHQ